MRLKLVDVWACLVNCKALCTVGWVLEVIYSGEQQKDPPSPLTPSAAAAVSSVRTCLKERLFSLLSQQEWEGLAPSVHVCVSGAPEHGGQGPGPQTGAEALYLVRW